MDPNSVSLIAESTDWGFVSTVVQIIISLITCIAMILASIVAIRGINAWSREFRGKRQIELAEEVLSLFYQARDVIESIRSPIGYLGEASTRKQVENETPEEKDALDRAYVVRERYEERREMFSKLQSLRYRFMAQIQIGKEEAKPFSEIRKVLNQILRASRRMALLCVPRHRPGREKKNVEKQIQKYEAILEGDEIKKRVEKAVSQIEETCRNIITRKSPKS